MRITIMPQHEKVPLQQAEPLPNKSVNSLNLVMVPTDLQNKGPVKAPGIISYKPVGIKPEIPAYKHAFLYEVNDSKLKQITQLLKNNGAVGLTFLSKQFPFAPVDMALLQNNLCQYLQKQLSPSSLKNTDAEPFECRVKTNTQFHSDILMPTHGFLSILYKPTRNTLNNFFELKDKNSGNNIHRFQLGYDRWFMGFVNQLNFEHRGAKVSARHPVTFAPIGFTNNKSEQHNSLRSRLLQQGFITRDIRRLSF